ncbi:hypothetical protein FJTKL_12042 [Diaporthe vaccinii]|uniref:Uncharacterized protein n=1 Tax=Diaporthe vaccinii TaxID=105482 RepID=A0ABR4FB51_9PEZI
MRRFNNNNNAEHAVYLATTAATRPRRNGTPHRRRVHMGEWQPRLGPSREQAAAPTQLEVLGRVPRQPVTWRQIGTTQLTPTNYYHRTPQTSSTDKSSSRWSPKSRLDGNDALSLLNLAPNQLQPTPNKPGPAFAGALYHHIYYIFLIYVHFRQARRGRNTIFLVSFSHVPLPTQHSRRQLLQKKKGGCPLMIPPREGNEANRPF